MAILKHIASKNADYGEAQRYLIFQHDEYTGNRFLMKMGKCSFGKNITLTVLTVTLSFNIECKELNARFHKNQKYDEIISHHYIISFDLKDRDEYG